jgi:ribonuclease P protein component
MLAKHQRVVTAADFKNTVRRGKRFVSEHAVVYVVGAGRAQGERIGNTARFGFIVSKSVGNAVQRNLVRRRLRAITAEHVASRLIAESVVVGRSGVSSGGCTDLHGTPQLVVVRLLSGAAEIPWSTLRSEVLSSFGVEATTP